MKPAKKLSLPVWIFIGMLAGILAGLCFLKNPDFTTNYLKPIGTIYINLLKFLVVPVVLFSITDGVISLKDLKRVGSVGIKTFVYYMITTAVAVVIGLALASAFKGFFPPLPSAELAELEYAAKEAPSVMQVIVGIFPDNILAPMVSANMLPVIVIAIFVGAGILAAGKKGEKIGEIVNCMNEVVMKIMMMIIKITPIGVFCLMANVVAVNGPEDCRHPCARDRRCISRLYHPCGCGIRKQHKVPERDESHRFFQRVGACDDMRIHHDFLQRNASAEHRMLQQYGR